MNQVLIVHLEKNPIFSWEILRLLSEFKAIATDAEDAKIPFLLCAGKFLGINFGKEDYET
jgi:hypothetical protein